MEPTHLILHERLQWLDHERRAGPQQHRYLKAQRLPGAGGPDGQNVLALEDGEDDWQLAGPQAIFAQEAEDRAEVEIAVGKLALKIEPASEPYRPPFKQAPREPHLEVQVQAGMASVAQGDEVSQ